MLASIKTHFRNICTVIPWKVQLFFSGWSIYFGWFWHKALLYDADGNIIAGHHNIWGDWAVHLTMTTAIAQRGFSISSPLLLDAQFSYPFFTNAVSATLLNIGVPLIPAMTIPSFILSIFLVVVLLWSYKTFFSCWNISIIATTFFLLSGGLGIFYLIPNILQSHEPLTEIISPSQMYTRIDTVGIKWINVIDSMIIPQRSFIVGFPVALLALTLMYNWITQVASKKDILKKHTFAMLIFAGVGLGLLPILQMHAFLVSFIIVTIWAIGSLFFIQLPKKRVFLKKNDWYSIAAVIWKEIQPWLFLACLVTCIALPLLIYIGVISLHPVHSGPGFHFFSIQLGWLASEYNQPWIYFALQNWGVLPLAAVIGLGGLLMSQSKKQRVKTALIFAPFFILFALANTIVFQPFVWDNTKIFIWSHFGFSGLTAWVIHKSWQRSAFHSNAKQKYSMQLAIIAVFITVIASGAVDSYRILRHDLSSHLFFTQSEIAAANWVIDTTDVHSVWLTGDRHNHWLFTMTGRQPVMAYRGWLWTHGYNYRQHEADIKKMYANPSDSVDLFQKYRISYVVVTDHEIIDWNAHIHEWQSIFPVVYKADNISIFKVDISK